MIYLPPCLSFLFVLHFILACVRSENFFFSEPTEPNFNDLVNDATLNLNENDPLNVAYLNSDELTWDFSDPVLNPIIQDEADPFINANDPFAGDNLLDLATLPDSCGIKDSPTNDVLRARDGKSCSPRKDNVDLPSGLFQDPEGYLRENVLPLPTGPSDSLDQGNIKEGDLGFGAFIRNRPFPVTPLEPNLQICDPRIFGLSNVPMCDNHLTGSVAKEPSKIYQYNLINAVPYTYLDWCPEPSELWCCAVIHIRLHNAPAVDPSTLTSEQYQFLSRLNDLRAYDAYFCFKQLLGLSLNRPLK